MAGFCIEIPLDFGEGGPIMPLRVSGGYLMTEDSQGERDYVPVTNSLTVLGGGDGPLPPAYVFAVRPTRGSAGEVVVLEEILGAHFQPGSSVALRQGSRRLYASHVTQFDSRRLRAVVPTAPTDVGLWDVAVIGGSDLAVLENAVSLSEGGGQGSSISLMDPTLTPEYIIIVPDRDGATTYRNAVQPLVNYRVAQGHGVLVADFDQIRTGWPAGDDTTRIKQFLAYAHANYRTMPQFVLLIGDAREGDQTYMIPTPLRGTDTSYPGEFDYSFAYDAAYVCVDNDLIPDCVIGRLPVTSTSELSLYVTKLIDHEARGGEPWTRRMSFLLGDLQTTGNDTWVVRAMGAALRPHVPEGLTLYEQRAQDYPEVQARENAALGEFNNGRIVVDAIGNTYPNELVYMINFDCTFPVCFQPGDLANNSMCPLLLTPTCIAASFDEDELSYRSIAERLLFIPNSAYKGVIGVLGATHTIRGHMAQAMDEAFYDVLPAAASIGVGQLGWAAKQRVLSGNPTLVDGVLQQVLLAEPVLQLAWQPPLEQFWSSMELSATLPRQNTLYGAPVNMGASPTLRILKVDGDVRSTEGERQLRLTGEDLSGADSRLEFLGYAVSIPITANCYLSYWARAEDSPAAHGHVGIDLVTQTGQRMSTWAPTIRDQCRVPVVPSTHHVEPEGTWRHYYIDLSRMQGQTITSITFLYDDGPSESGTIRAYFDAVQVMWTDNEFLDGSFEADANADNRPDFWSGPGLDDTAQIGFLDREDYVDGDKSLLIFDDSPSGSAVCQAVTVFGQPEVLRNLSFQAKAAAPASLTVRIEDRDNPDPPLFNQAFAITTGWNTYTASVTIPTPAHYRDLFVSFVPATAQLEYYVDDATLEPPQAIGIEPAMSVSTGLHQSWPNPMRKTTVIPYSIGARGHAEIRIYDVSGRLVRLLLDEADLEPGERTVVWDGRSEHGQPVGSGVYFYELIANGVRTQRKLVIVE